MCIKTCGCSNINRLSSEITWIGGGFCDTHEFTNVISIGKGNHFQITEIVFSQSIKDTIWYIIALVIFLIALCGCSDDSYQVSQVKPVTTTTKDTGFIWIIIDLTVPNFTQVGGYKLGDEYFMPDCQDLQDGTRTVDVDVTNITKGFIADKRAKDYFNSCK